jgi:hypothetical protein
MRGTFQPRAARQLQIGEVQQYVAGVAGQGSVHREVIEVRAVGIRPGFVQSELTCARLPPAGFDVSVFQM